MEAARSAMKAPRLGMTRGSYLISQSLSIILSYLTIESIRCDSPFPLDSANYNNIVRNRCSHLLPYVQN